MKDSKPNKESVSRLQVTTFKLHWLLNITLAINANLTQEELLKIYEKLLTQDLSIGKVLIFIFEDKWKCILRSGEVGKLI